MAPATRRDIGCAGHAAGAPAGWAPADAPEAASTGDEQPVGKRVNSPSLDSIGPAVRSSAAHLRDGPESPEGLRSLTAYAWRDDPASAEPLQGWYDGRRGARAHYRAAREGGKSCGKCAPPARNAECAPCPTRQTRALLGRVNAKSQIEHGHGTTPGPPTRSYFVERKGGVYRGVQRGRARGLGGRAQGYSRVRSRLCRADLQPRMFSDGEAQ